VFLLVYPDTKDNEIVIYDVKTSDIVTITATNTITAASAATAE